MSLCYHCYLAKVNYLYERILILMTFGRSFKALLGGARQWFNNALLWNIPSH